MDSFSCWICSTQAPTLVTLRSHSKVSNQLQLLIFVATTRFYHRLIIDLISVDACVVRRYKIFQISQRVTHKSSKTLQNLARVSLLYVDKLDWNHKRFRGLGPGLKFAKSDFYDSWSIGPNSRSIELSRFWLFFSIVSLNFEAWNLHLEQCLTYRLDMFCSWFSNAHKI